MAYWTREPKELERRRQQGAALLAQGLSKAEVARRLGVTRQAVWDWERRLAEGGHEGLKREPQGRPRQLNVEQEKILARIITVSARKAGFASEVWTMPRIRQLIAKQFGIKCSDASVWNLLRRMGFTFLKPEERALQPTGSRTVRWRRLPQKTSKKEPGEKDAAQALFPAEPD
ncbi:MAG: winged helix-turn-helix domain-containing protein [Candidatus Accumulibacter sp.]|jgi:transposase|nr:winged helix-turn-helix domain-containing protein [Accumulibacter sp.]